MAHTAREHAFSSFDGTQLFYRSWLPETGVNGKASAVVILHRGHEHSARVAHLVDELNLPDHAFFAWDQRGHGRSPGERGYAPHVMDLVRDIDAFVAHIGTAHGIPVENIFVIAHSVAAVLAAAWLQSYAPKLRGMVLVTPAFKVKLYVPLALPALRLGQYLKQRRDGGTLYVKSYVKGHMLTHDTAFAASYDTDPLVSKQIAANVLLGLFDLSKRVVQDAGSIVAPVLLLSARADWVVKNLPQRRFFRRISSSFKRVAVYRGLFHGLLQERDREPIVREIRDFIQDAGALAVDRSALTGADRQGYTYEEYQWLSAGLPMLSPRRWNYVVQQAVMKTLGCVSEGIRLGWRTGFDSGESLNYVYQNEARGDFGIGKMFDRIYLDSVGWRGIRQRKKHIEELLEGALAELSAADESRPVRIVDVAGGPARYVLDAVRKRNPGRCEVLIRDWSVAGLDRGKALAASLGLADVATYERGDAFSLESLAEIEPADIVIVSGLYELFPDNAMVSRSLEGIGRIVRPGGYLLYTGQPWHPQLEMIAEVLVNRDGKPWVMRRRTQAELDELVCSKGFAKARTRVDNDGIFTVSLARKGEGAGE